MRPSTNRRRSERRKATHPSFHRSTVPTRPAPRAATPMAASGWTRAAGAAAVSERASRAVWVRHEKKSRPNRELRSPIGLSFSRNWRVVCLQSNRKFRKSFPTFLRRNQHREIGELEWVEQTQYGMTREEIADAIVAEWLEAGGGNPEWGYLWFVTRRVLETSRRWQAR